MLSIQISKKMNKSYCQTLRRLSVQAEESGLDEPLEDDFVYVSRTKDGGLQMKEIVSKNSAEFEIHSGNNTDNGLDTSNLRKFSVASTGSNKSISSITSTCSEPPNPSPISYPTKKIENYGLPTMTRRLMTSRPSFISLCSIVSETSEPPPSRHYLPAPLQVELDLDQRSGMADEPKCRSHLPILRSSSDYDINLIGKTGNVRGQGLTHDGGLINEIKKFPRRIPKLSSEKNRFNVYSISDDTREQLKHMYVY